MKFYFICVFLCVCSSCQEMLTAESHDRSIFEQPGNYYYQTTILSSEDDFIFNDTLQLETYGKKWMYDDIQWQIGWHYPMDIRTFKTGVVVSEDSIWMHPPRNGLFSILEGNAFPCVYPNDSIHQKRTITIRANPKDWFQLDGLDSVGVVSFFSEYVRLEDSLFTLGNETEKAFHYQAITTSPLGNSLSEFYYTQKWGFVRMRFETLRNERIDMELANIHKAQSQL